jgi:hypothetical protein
MSRWEYSALVCEDRQRRLHAAPSFETISSQVATTMRVLCQHPDPCDEAAGYQRMVYCISVEPELFDLFFNSWNGYRAQYFRDPDYGQARNIEFIKAISPGLLTPRGAVPNPQLATTSLAGGSAKVWLAEVGKGFCAQCAGEWRTAQDEEPEIVNDRWELSEATGSTATMTYVVQVGGSGPGCTWTTPATCARPVRGAGPATAQARVRYTFDLAIKKTAAKGDPSSGLAGERQGRRHVSGSSKQLTPQALCRSAAISLDDAGQRV